MKLEFNTRGNIPQKECVKAWVNNDKTEILLGGAKGGSKSFTGCKLIFGDGLIYPETFYFIARKKLNDLRKFTIPSIHECFNDWNTLAIYKKDGLDPDKDKLTTKQAAQKIVVMDKLCRFNGQDNYYELHNGSRIYLLEVAYQPGDPLYSRFGSLQFTRGWGEELGEWEEAAANNLQAAIGRWNNTRYSLSPKFLMTCNPSKNFLYRKYYKPWKEGTLKTWQIFIQSLPTDNKMLAPEYILNLERSLSKTEKERLLFGNWEYLDDPAALIDYEKILDIFTNTHIPEGEKFITCDIARLGGDKIVIIEWSGWCGRIRYYTKQTLDVTTTYIQAAMLRNQTGHSNTLIDSDGMGGGPVDMLKVKGFTNNARALPSPTSPYNEKGVQVPENFDNLKSQCYFRLADRINKNGLYLECETEEIRQWVVEELEQVKQKLLDSDMKKGVVPKDKVKEALGRSPDFADTIMMREYFELKPVAQFNDAEY